MSGNTSVGNSSADQQDDQWLELNPKAKRAKSRGYATKNKRSDVEFMVANEQYIPLQVKYIAHTVSFSCRCNRESEAGKPKSSFKCQNCGIFLYLEQEKKCSLELHK